MKYLIYIIISFLSLNAAVAFAQPYNYYDAQKKAAKEKAFQKSLDDAIPKRGSGASTTKYRWEIEREKQEAKEKYARERIAAEEVAERNKKEKEAEERKNTPTNSSVRKLSEEQISKNAEEIGLSELKEAELRPIMEKNFKQYDFLTANEVEVLARISSEYSYKTEKIIKHPINYMHFNEIKNTGNYVELKNLILGFSTLTNKAVEALEFLNKRFPENMHETDSLMIKMSDFRYPDLELTEACKESYRGLSPRLSAALLNSSGIWRDVTKSMVEKIKVEKQKSPVNTIELLQAEKEFADVAGESLYRYHAHTNLKEYLETLSASELFVIANKKNISPSFLALNQNATYYCDLISNTEATWKDFINANKSNNSIVKSFEKIKQLANLGDLSAMHLYGIYILRGYTTEDKSVGEAFKQKAKDKNFNTRFPWDWR